MSHRRIVKPAYIWGALSNTEPPEDDEMIVGYYDAPETYVPQCFVCGADASQPCQGRDGQVAECPR